MFTICLYIIIIIKHCKFVEMNTFIDLINTLRNFRLSIKYKGENFSHVASIFYTRSKKECILSD